MCTMVHNLQFIICLRSHCHFGMTDEPITFNKHSPRLTTIVKTLTNPSPHLALTHHLLNADIDTQKY